MKFLKASFVGSKTSNDSTSVIASVASPRPAWNGTFEDAQILQEGLGYYEDGVLCLNINFKHFKFASKEQACEFAQGGNRNPDYLRAFPFGFHRTWQTINFATGKVDSSDTSKDLTASYEHEI